MQSGVKREAPTSSLGEKREKIAKLDRALDKVAKDIEKCNETMKELHKAYVSHKSVCLRTEAKDAILKFMKAHSSGLTSVLHVREGVIREVIVSVFNEYKLINHPGDNFGFLHIPIPKPDNKLIDDIDEILGKGAFAEFVSVVSVSLQGSAYLVDGEERASVYLTRSSKDKISCKRENFIEVGTRCISGSVIFYTNSKKK